MDNIMRFIEQIGLRNLIFIGIGLVYGEAECPVFDT